MDEPDAPWCWPRWQEKSHCFHAPWQDRTSSDSRWPQSKIDAVRAFATQCRTYTSFEQRAEFFRVRAGQDEYAAGREILKKFTTDIVKKIGIRGFLYENLVRSGQFSEYWDRMDIGPDNVVRRSLPVNPAPS